MLRIFLNISGLTLISRISGLLREIILASQFGSSALTDAFFIAFRVPNLFRRLFAEGAFSQAFVPQLSKIRKNRTDAIALAFAGLAASGLFTILLPFCILGILLAPELVTMIASGLTQHSSVFKHATTMTQIMFPYIFFMSMIAMMSGVLNTWDSFRIPAAAPILLNVAMISAMLTLPNYLNPPIYSLAIGVIVGGLLQFLFVYYGLRQKKLSISFLTPPKKVFLHPEVRSLLKKMLPMIFALSVAQISLIINTNIATHLRTGSVSWLSYADRIMELPTALLGVALATLLLPKLSKAEPERYNVMLNWGLRLLLLLVLPAAVALITLGKAMTATLFNYGQFNALDVSGTYRALIGYGVGLTALIMLKILVAAFYARGDVKTPVKVAVLALIITQLSNLVLVPYFNHMGLALSISIGALFNSATLWIILFRRGIYQPTAHWIRFLVRILLALALFTITSRLLALHFDWIQLALSPLLRVATLGFVMLLSLLAYVVALVLLGFRFSDIRFSEV